MEILLAQLEKKINYLLNEKHKLQEDLQTMLETKQILEEDNDALVVKNNQLNEQKEQLEEQMQNIENRLFHIVDSVAGDPTQATLAPATLANNIEPKSDTNSEQELEMTTAPTPDDSYKNNEPTASDTNTRDDGTR